VSTLTKCNHCTLERMKRRRPGVEVIVTQIPVGREMEGWYSARYADEEEPSAYFMQLTVGCAC
jgi:hypothetical protein